MMPKRTQSTTQTAKSTAVSGLLPQTHVQPLAERAAIGRALRERCSRKALAEWERPAKRADPIDLLIENSRGRLEDLIPIRYGRMLASPFAFFRGAAAIMAYDLSHTPVTGLNLQACGDCHLLNFGGFATAERKLIFDINDFDETSIAPWEWDVKRLAASFVVAGRANGFVAGECREAARLAAQSYREHTRQYAQMPVLQAWYEAIDLVWVFENTLPQMRRFYQKKLKAATEQSAHEKEFAKLAHAAGYPARIIDQPPLIFHMGDIRDEQFRANVELSLARYRQTLPPDRRLLLDRYKLADVAMKVVGVGSVGTFCAIVLLMSGNSEPLFLQVKEARQSVLEPYAGTSSFTHPGERVVTGQRLMQAAGDMFLGWTTGESGDGRSFYVRQLADAKIKPVVEIMQPLNLRNYAGLCGWALAQAHARSSDAVVLSAYMGKSTVFVENERDHAALVAAVRDGRVEARQVE
jgi:uncharacterized protein (DUF2252 family)